MRRTTTVLLTSALLSAATMSVAEADTPGCVSKREFNRVSVGMAQARVHRIFDTAGEQTGLGAPNVLYYYKSCRSAGGVVQVTYDSNLRVVGKSGYWFN